MRRRPLAKEVHGTLKITLPAGTASPTSTVAAVLGSNGINVTEFCRGFNRLTQAETPGTPRTAVVTKYWDRTFSFRLEQPTA